MSDMANEEESVLWRGCPSQWLNLVSFLFCLAALVGIAIGGLFFPLAWSAMVLPTGWAFWKYLCIKSQGYELTTERLKVFRGVINQTVDEIELYRIKDSVLIRSWWMRIAGLASISLETSDRTMPNLEMPAIPDGGDVREMLRKQVEAQRDRKRVRELDFDETSGG